MTIKTRVLGLLQFAQGDREKDYLEKWLALSIRQVDAEFDPVSGHNHSGSAGGAPIASTSGNLAVQGNITLGAANTVGGTIQFGSDGTIHVDNAGGTWYWHGNGMSILSPGSSNTYQPIAASAFNVNSALASKRDVHSITARALALVCEPALRGVGYTGRHSGVHRLGFVADTWAEFLPEAVGYRDGQVDTLDYDQIVPILWEVVRILVQKAELC